MFSIIFRFFDRLKVHGNRIKMKKKGLDRQLNRLFFILDDDDDDKCTVIVALMQKNRRAQRKFGLDCLTIGYTIYHVSSNVTFILIHSIETQVVVESNQSILTRRKSEIDSRNVPQLLWSFSPFLIN